MKTLSSEEIHKLVSTNYKNVGDPMPVYDEIERAIIEKIRKDYFIIKKSSVEKMMGDYNVTF